MIKINTLQLSNGLRLLHHHDPHTQMSAVNVLYDVGSRDEVPGHTGLAHLFEHLMFGGTDKVPNFDEPLLEAGGESNAWTSTDLTNFYEIVPAQNIETALWLESDRLANMTITPQSLQVQREVVAEELKQRCLNVPYGDIDHLLRAAAFTTHPYRWPVIGERLQDIEGVTIDDARQFFASHYAPGNAILCITGNITFERAARLTEKWFGHLPPRPIAPRRLPIEPEQGGARLHRERREVPQDVIVKAYHTCGHAHQDFPVCDIISDLLANGNSSRFHTNIMMKADLFTDLDAMVWGSIDPGLLVIKGRLAPGVSIEAAEKAIRAEVDKLADGDASQYEIEKYVNKLESKESFENISYAEKASKMCYYQLARGDAQAINHEIDRYRTITPEQVAQEAQKMFDFSNETTILYGPNV